MKSVMLHEVTRSAFEEYLKQNPDPIALIPLGSIEQHGPHLPLGTDSLIAVELCRKTAERTGSFVVQPCWPGYSPHHMAFAGTITFRHETLVNILLDTFESLAHHGVRKIMVVNCHGGNAQIMAYAIRIGKRETGACIASPVMNPRSAEEAARTAMKYLDMHSGAGETGMALALFPELVEMQRVEGWKPTTHFIPGLEKLADPKRDDVEIAAQIVMSYINDTHELTSSGIYGFRDPNDADVESSRKRAEERIEHLVKYIELWKTVPSPGECCCKEE